MTVVFSNTLYFIYFHTDLRFAAGTVICVDKIYNGMGCIIHINVWWECVQIYSM